MIDPAGHTPGVEKATAPPPVALRVASLAKETLRSLRAGIPWRRRIMEGARSVLSIPIPRPTENGSPFFEIES